MRNAVFRVKFVYQLESDYINASIFSAFRLFTLRDGKISVSFIDWNRSIPSGLLCLRHGTVYCSHRVNYDYRLVEYLLCHVLDCTN